MYCYLLSHFSRVRLCATPETAAHQAPPSLGLSRQEHWSGLPFPPSNAWKWKVKGKSLSHVQLLATPWTAAHQTSPSMGFFQARVLGVHNSTYNNSGLGQKALEDLSVKRVLLIIYCSIRDVTDEHQIWCSQICHVTHSQYQWVWSYSEIKSMQIYLAKLRLYWIRAWLLSL